MTSTPCVGASKRTSRDEMIDKFGFYFPSSRRRCIARSLQRNREFLDLSNDEDEDELLDDEELREGLFVQRLQPRFMRISSGGLVAAFRN